MELAELALNRMAVDKLNEVTVYDSMDLESASDDTFIASATSPSQRVGTHSAYLRVIYAHVAVAIANSFRSSVFTKTMSNF